MPVTIRHLYNSALCDYQYTKNESIMLNTADFSAMKLGLGYRLNLMQSMVNAEFFHDEENISGYVYVGENGEEVYFKESEKQKSIDEAESYNLYEDTDSGEMLYDPRERTLTQGDDVYTFDTVGRLVCITDGAGNHMDITYAEGRITTVTDGAGRDFTFSYDDDGYLAAIIAPDNSQVRYYYLEGNLTSVSYPNGTIAEITYYGSKPYQVDLIDDGNFLYKVTYSFESDRVCRVTEYGENGGSMGNKTTYGYYISSGRTIVQTTEPADSDDGESKNNVIKTVYIFDDDGNIVSKYVPKTNGHSGIVCLAQHIQIGISQAYGRQHLL